MTEKRYFSVDYDEEYYIFDSTKISKEEVLEKAEYSYDVFGESLMEDDVVNLLNENEQLKKENECLKEEIRLLKVDLDNVDLFEERKVKYSEFWAEKLKKILGD